MRGSFKANGRPHKRAQPNLEQREGSSETTRIDDLSDARRRPGRGDGSLRQCVSCGCAVPANGWEQHMNGIRHRRNQASMTLMGEPGHLVRSIFEPDPTDIPETYRGKDPVALRAQQLRHLMVAADDEDGGGEQQQQQQQRQQRQAPARRQPRAEGQPAPQRHRPHSEAFAQLQARREQRLLGAAAAQPPSPPVSDSSASESGSDTSRSEASDSGSDGEPHGGGAAGCSPSHRHHHAPSAAAQHQLPRQRQAVAAAAEWRPDEAAVSGLVAAARRQAVHHTGLGPLYQGALGSLDAGALRTAAAGLQERLGRYRPRLDAWLLQQQQHGHGQQRQGLPPAVGEGGGGNGDGGSAAGAENEAAAVLARGFESNAGGNAGGGERSDDNDSDTSSSSSSSSSSDENGSEGGWERRRGLAARAAMRVTGQQQQQPEPQRRRRRPYLRLGPAELLLLSIHPAVAATRSRGAGSETPTASASSVEAATAAAARQTAAGCGTSRRPDSAFSGQVGHRQRWAQPATAATAAPRQLRPAQAAAPSARAPPPPLRHLYLEVPFKPHGREAAAYATAMGVLLAALRRGPGGGGSDGLEAFGLRFSREDYLQVLGQGGAARLAPLESLWQLAPALVQLMQARPGMLRELRLCCPPGLLDAGRVESLQRAAVDASLRNQRRLAVLMGSHARLGAASPLRTLPREVLEMLLDRALPRRPCRLVLGLRKWLPGQRQRQSRRREAAPGGPGGLAAGGADAAAAAAEAVWAAPAAAAAAPAAGAAAAPPPPPQQQQQQQQLLPLDVRVAARHAARR